MLAACRALEDLEHTSGSLAKLEILKQQDSPELRFLLDTALNPFLTYGVVLDPADVTTHHPRVVKLADLEEIKADLVKRAISGDAAREFLAKTIASSDILTAKWLLRAFNKNLRAGIAAGLVDKAYPGFLPSFNLALCKEIKPADVAAQRLPEGQWWVSKKIDGVRCVAFIDAEHNVTFYSRSGKALSNLGVIEEQLQLFCKRSGIRSSVFDGELFNKEKTWNATISVVHASKTDKDATSVLFLIFDVVPVEAWDTDSSPVFSKRYNLLEASFTPEVRDACPNLQLVRHDPVGNFSEAKAYLQRYLDEGFEGVVLKNGEAVYPFSRSKDWLKWKTVLTVECKIVGFEEGEGKHLGRLGAFLVELNGVEIRVGGGFSDHQREEFWKHRKKLIGDIMEVKAQEITKDGSLRFPVFVRMRDDINL